MDGCAKISEIKGCVETWYLFSYLVIQKLQVTKCQLMYECDQYCPFIPSVTISFQEAQWWKRKLQPRLRNCVHSLMSTHKNTCRQGGRGRRRGNTYLLIDNKHREGTVPMLNVIQKFHRYFTSATSFAYFNSKNKQVNVINWAIKPNCRRTTIFTFTETFSCQGEIWLLWDDPTALSLTLSLSIREHIEWSDGAKLFIPSQLKVDRKKERK